MRACCAPTATTTARRKQLQHVLQQYPQDRVARNDLGRVLFLSRKYPEAMAQLQQVIAVDPEDLQANYNLMLCYKGMGDGGEGATSTETLHALQGRRVVADHHRALSQTHPEDNNERQLIHEHVSRPARAREGRREIAEKHCSDRRGQITESMSRIRQSACHLAVLRSRSLQRSPGHISRYHQAGRHQLRAQQRRGRQEIAAGNHGPGVRLHRLRQRRLSRHPAGQWQGLAAARASQRR